jgi:hypothetical protein
VKLFNAETEQNRSSKVGAVEMWGTAELRRACRSRLNTAASPYRTGKFHRQGELG